MQRRNIYLITTYFPPIQSVATLRMSAFAAYIDKSLFNVTIVTPKIPSRDVITQEMRFGVKIQELPSRAPWRFTFKNGEPFILHKFKAATNVLLSLILLDNNSSFTNAAISYLKNELRQEQTPSIVITSYAPLSSLKVGLHIKRHNPQTIWISDLRDELSQNTHLPKLTRYLFKNFERQMLNWADAITSVSKPILDYFEKLNNRRFPIKFVEIRNGFDFPIIQEAPSRVDSIFEIIYTGSFYGSIKPDNFLLAFTKFALAHQDLQIRLKIIGNKAPLRIPSEIENNILQLPSIPYEEIPSALASADVLLMIHPADGRTGVYTTKLFDYLAVNRPILALVDPKDVAANLIETAQAGISVANENIEGINKALTTLLELKKSRTSLNRNWEVVNGLSRKSQIQHLNTLLKTLSNTNA